MSNKASERAAQRAVYLAECERAIFWRAEHDEQEFPVRDAARYFRLVERTLSRLMAADIGLMWFGPEPPSWFGHD